MPRILPHMFRAKEWAEGPNSGVGERAPHQRKSWFPNSIREMGNQALPPRPERNLFPLPVGCRAARRRLESAHGMENGPVKKPDDENLEIQSPLEVGDCVPTLLLDELPQGSPNQKKAPDYLR